MAKGLALIIGASGGIGQECVKQAKSSAAYTDVLAVSRTQPKSAIQGVRYAQIDSEDEQQIADYCSELAKLNTPIACVICCIGALHFEVNGQTLMPEKRLEDINYQQMLGYFNTNTLLPALWIKYLVPLMKSAIPAHFVCLSARVGSIQDNQLGGWYGYRASKAALNMLMKSAQIECQRRAKNLCFVSYHPGTVDTQLSKPFQQNVAKGKLFSRQFSVATLMQMLPNLEAEQGPHFIDWQGKPISW
ncbi:SDR family NAD(P)-dependent oxidoreductase [Paraglaciecola aestuariivivens]